MIQAEVTQTVNGPLVELNRVGDNLVAERFEFKADVTATQTSINTNLKAVQDLIVSLRKTTSRSLPTSPPCPPTTSMQTHTCLNMTVHA